MIKKVGLAVFIITSNINASDEPKTGFIEKIKHSSVTAKIVGGVIPCLATFVAMDAVMKAYKDDPQKDLLVNTAYYIKWTSLIIAAFFCDWLFKIDFKRWILSYPQKDTSIGLGDIHTPQKMNLILVEKID